MFTSTAAALRASVFMLLTNQGGLPVSWMVGSALTPWMLGVFPTGRVDCPACLNKYPSIVRVRGPFLRFGPAVQVMDR
jgi:hypothetical protein